MKHVILLSFLLTFLVSCEKTELPYIPENPEWLEQKINELEDGPSYGGIKINIFLWNNEYYYHILNPISSCMFCELFSYQGEKIVWAEGMLNDFFENGKFIVCIWKHNESSIKSFPIESSYPIRRLGIEITGE